MKKREGFWFMVGCWIVERLIFRGYHLSKMPKKGADRKAPGSVIPYSQEKDEYPKSGE